MKVLAAGAVVATALIVTIVSVSNGRPADDVRWSNIDVSTSLYPATSLGASHPFAYGMAQPPSPAVERALLSRASTPIPTVLTSTSFTRTASMAPTRALGARGISIDALDAVINRYCGQCHNQTMKRGNLVLRDYSLDTIMVNRALSEKMIRKLRAEMMPPPGSRRPKGDTLLALVETMESLIDNAEPINPGSRVFQRLNRPEYERVVSDLLGVAINAGDYLPLDTKSANFDNISDAQALSATLLDAYLNAAAAVSRMAVGDRNAAPKQTTYRTSPFT